MIVTVAFPLDLVTFALSYHILQHNTSLQQMHLSRSLNPNSQLPVATSRVAQLAAQLYSCAHLRLITTEPPTPHFFFPMSQGHAGKCR